MAPGSSPGQLTPHLSLAWSSVLHIHKSVWMFYRNFKVNMSQTQRTIFFHPAPVPYPSAWHCCPRRWLEIWELWLLPPLWCPHLINHKANPDDPTIRNSLALLYLAPFPLPSPYLDHHMLSSGSLHGTPNRSPCIQFLLSSNLFLIKLWEGFCKRRYDVPLLKTLQ